jgi:hypothetical protein
LFLIPQDKCVIASKHGRMVLPAHHIPAKRYSMEDTHNAERAWNKETAQCH